MTAKIGVLGGGAFGWGLAYAAERAGREALLWSRRPQREASGKIALVRSPAELAAAELVFFAVPSPVMPELASEHGEHLSGAHYLVDVSRGIAPPGPSGPSVGEELMPLVYFYECTPGTPIDGVESHGYPRSRLDAIAAGRQHLGNRPEKSLQFPTCGRYP